MSKTTRDEAGGPAIDELLITASPYGMRAAAVAAGRPVAVFIEPRAKPSRIGDLHVARPLGRMKGIDACIVDIGEGEEAFLQGARSLDADGAQLVVQVVCDAYEGKRASGHAATGAGGPLRYLQARRARTDLFAPPPRSQGAARAHSRARRDRHVQRRGDDQGRRGGVPGRGAGRCRRAGGTLGMRSKRRPSATGLPGAFGRQAVCSGGCCAT